MKSNRILFYLTGIISVIFLGWVIVVRKPPQLPPDEPIKLEPDSAFAFYLEDEMDYGVEFSKHVVEKRIDDLEQIALVHPDKKFEAQRVIDSLRARLDRGAVIKKKKDEYQQPSDSL